MIRISALSVIIPFSSQFSVVRYEPPQVFQRSDDERYRRPYLMGNHRKETETGLAGFLLLGFLQTPYLLLMAMLGTVQTKPDIVPDGS
jgi:hypothetical protein